MQSAAVLRRRRLAARYRKFVTEPKQEEKVNTGVYLHAR